MISGKCVMRIALFGPMALALATLTTEARAQSGGEIAHGSDARKAMPLSAAVAEVRRSPFYAPSAVSLGSSIPRHLWVPVAAGSAGPSNQSVPSDSTVSSRRVFWAAVGSSALTMIPGFYLVLGSLFTDRTDAVFPYVLAGYAVQTLGPAVGAPLAGARFAPALAGSALGVATSWTAFLAVSRIVDPNDLALPYFVLHPVIQAAVTTAITSRSN